jgi:hypothetical protein
MPNPVHGGARLRPAAVLMLATLVSVPAAVGAAPSSPDDARRGVPDGTVVLPDDPADADLGTVVGSLDARIRAERAEAAAAARSLGEARARLEAADTALAEAVHRVDAPVSRAGALATPGFLRPPIRERSAGSRRPSRLGDGGPVAARRGAAIDRRCRHGRTVRGGPRASRHRGGEALGRSCGGEGAGAPGRGRAVRGRGRRRAPGRVPGGGGATAGGRVGRGHHRRRRGTAGGGEGPAGRARRLVEAPKRAAAAKAKADAAAEAKAEADAEAAARARVEAAALTPDPVGPPTGTYPAVRGTRPSSSPRPG